MEKSSTASGVTVRLTDTVCVVGGDEESPAIVRLKVPVAAVLVVAIVRIELAPACTVEGLNAPVAPAGNPLSDRLTGLALPVVTCVFTVKVVLEPCTTVRPQSAAPVAESLRPELGR